MALTSRPLLPIFQLRDGCAQIGSMDVLRVRVPLRNIGGPPMDLDTLESRTQEIDLSMTPLTPTAFSAILLLPLIQSILMMISTDPHPGGPL